MKFMDSLLHALRRDYPDLDDNCVMFPLRQLLQKKNGKWREVMQPVLPGYTFMFLNDEDPFPSMQLRLCPGFYRVLKYTDGSHELKGIDLQYVQWMLQNKGLLKPSKVSFDEGNNIRVLSGCMKDMQGKVIKVDKHGKRVVVEFEFAGEMRRVNLSIEIVAKEELPN